MSSSASTMVIYGIKLTTKEAKKLATLRCANSGFSLSSYPDYEVDMYSENTDIAIHESFYEEGFESVFGINYADSFGGDDIVKSIKKVPARVIKQYDKYAIPFLTKLKINKKAEVLAIIQTG